MKGTFLFVLLILSWASVDAQKVLLQGLEGYEQVTSGIIEGDDDMVGYYFYYRGDEQGDVYDFKLEIYNESLKHAKTLELKRPIRDQLIGVAFNENRVLCKFVNTKSKEYTYVAFGTKGEEIFAKSVSSPRKIKSVNSDKVDAKYIDVKLYSLSNKGFVDYSLLNSKKQGYIITMISNEGELSTLQTEKKSRRIQRASYIGYDDQKVYSMVLKRPKKKAKKGLKWYVVAHSIAEGTEVFEEELDGLGYDVNPINSYLDKRTGHILVQSYLTKENKGLTGIARGLGSSKVSTYGDLLKTDILEFDGSIRRGGKVNKRGKFKKWKFLQPYAAVPTDDGFVFLNQSYKRGVSSLSLMFPVFGSIRDLRTGGFVFLTVNKDMEYVSMKKVKKKPSQSVFGFSSNFKSIGYLAAKGNCGDVDDVIGFDFWQLDEETKKFVGFYYSPSGSGRGKYKMVKISNGDISYGTLPAYSKKQRKKRSVSFYPARKGYLLKRESRKVGEYQWEYDFTFEKIDF